MAYTSSTEAVSNLTDPVPNLTDPTTTQTAPNLSPQDYRNLIGALANIKAGDIQIDYEGMKNTLGLGSEASARGIWARLKKKVFVEGGTSAALADAIATTGKAKSPRKSNKAAKSAAVFDEATAEDDDVDNAEASIEMTTPTKVSPKKRGKNGGINGDDEELKPLKKARKSPVKKPTVVVDDGNNAGGLVNTNKTSSPDPEATAAQATGAVTG